MEEAQQAAKEANIEPPANPPVTHGSSEPDVLEKAQQPEQAGNETPIPQTNGQDQVLEATPAAIGEELR